MRVIPDPGNPGFLPGIGTGIPGAKTPRDTRDRDRDRAPGLITSHDQSSRVTRGLLRHSHLANMPFHILVV